MHIYSAHIQIHTHTYMHSNTHTHTHTIGTTYGKLTLALWNSEGQVLG